MQHLAKDFVRLLGLVACLELVSLAASAQPPPKAPTNLCIAGAVCVASTAPAAPGVSAPTPPPSAPPSGGAKKWHPGHYMQTWRNSSYLFSPDYATAQKVRFADYDSIASNANIKGVRTYYMWSMLEGATHGDYAAGFALLHAEINKVKGLAQPKRLVVIVMDSANYSICNSQACQNNFFPSYFVAAGCVGASTSNGIQTKIKSWDPVCRGYLTDMMKAYGAEFDREPFLEGFMFPYETIMPPDTPGYSADAYDKGMKEIILAMSKAFPTTNLGMTLNYFIDPAHTASLAAYAASIGVGWGDGDTCNGADTQGGTWGHQVTIGLMGGHDYRGEVPLMWGVEASELGYGVVCGPLSPSPDNPPSGYSAKQVYAVTNDQIHTNFMYWEHNIFIGANSQRWYNCDPDGAANCAQTSNPGGILTLINTTPLTHTACPTVYDKLYGNGAAGSGCNTR